MMTLYSAVKVVYGVWHLKRARECFVVFVRTVTKHIKTGENVKYATAPGTRYRKLQYQSMAVQKNTSSQ